MGSKNKGKDKNKYNNKSITEIEEEISKVEAQKQKLSSQNKGTKQLDGQLKNLNAALESKNNKQAGIKQAPATPAQTTNQVNSGGTNISGSGTNSGVTPTTASTPASAPTSAPGQTPSPTPTPNGGGTGGPGGTGTNTTQPPPDGGSGGGGTRKPITITDADVKEAEKILSDAKEKFGVNDAFKKYEGNSFAPNSPFPKSSSAQEPDGVFKSVGRFFKSYFDSKVQMRQDAIPKYAEDAERARQLGMEVQETTMSKKFITDESLKKYKAINQVNGSDINIDGLSSMKKEELETWQNMIQQDTNKPLHKGERNNPFKYHEYTDDELKEYQTQFEDNEKQLRENLKRDFERSNVPSEEIDGKIEERFKSKTKKLVGLDSDSPEVKEGIERFNAYNDKTIDNSVIPTDPNSRVADNIRKADEGPIPKDGERINLNPKSQVLESYKPTMGAEGIGLGFKGSMNASRGKHLARAAHFFNPFGAGGASTVQGLRESVGILHKNQKVGLKSAGIGRRAMLAAPGAFSAITTVPDIFKGEDAEESYKGMASNIGFMNGWRKGSAIGSLAGAPNTKMRGFGTLTGGLTGGLLTGMAYSAIVETMYDLSSNESGIRSFARNLSSKELYDKGEMTRQSLTMRQAGLQKLARSGLNDRGLLLGNEASVLAGIM